MSGKKTLSMEKLYDRGVSDKEPPFSKLELHCLKTNTELLTFRKKVSISSSAGDEHSVSSTWNATAPVAHAESYKRVKQ